MKKVVLVPVTVKRRDRHLYVIDLRPYVHSPDDGYGAAEWRYSPENVIDPSQPLPEAAVRAGLMAYCRISDDEYDWFMDRVGQGDDRFVQDLKTVKGILAAGVAALMEGAE